MRNRCIRYRPRGEIKITECVADFPGLADETINKEFNAAITNIMSVRRFGSVTDAGPSWKEFEDIIARLQRAFHPTARITRDERLAGRNSGRARQIDICVREKVGVQEILIIVECKRWRRKIDVKTVEAFAGVLEDVGAHAGIIISTAGSSTGARNTAARKHINVYSYRDTKSEQWPNGLKVPILVEAWILRPLRYALRDGEGKENELTADTDINLLDSKTGVPMRLGNVLSHDWRRGSDWTEGNFQIARRVSGGALPEKLLIGFNVRSERFLRNGMLHFAGIVDEEARRAHAPGYQIFVEGESRPLTPEENMPRNFAGIGLIIRCVEVEPNPALTAPKRNAVIYGSLEVSSSSNRPIVIALEPPEGI